jgi:hypothetical protein
MLGPDVVVAHAPGFFDRGLKDLFGGRRQLNATASVTANTRETLNHLLNTRRLKAEFTKHTTGDATLLAN